VIIAGLQLDIVWENPAENFRRTEVLAREAVDQGARVLALPELFATGFSMRSEAMAVHAAEVRGFLTDTAVQHGVWVIGGYAEPGVERPANACGIFDPNGDEVLHYRKIHPFSLASEPEHYEAGRDLFTLEIEGVRVTPLICYDLRFPELFRTAATATDLYVVIANWPTRRAHAWRTLLAARAIDDQAWVLGVNRGVVTGKVDPAVVTDARKHFSFLDDRRPEVYRRLEDGDRTRPPKKTADHADKRR